MDDLKITINYLGQRARSPFNDVPWENHAYIVTLELDGSIGDFPYSTGTGWMREPEEWLANIKFAPDYIQRAWLDSDLKTGAPRFSRRVRERFHKERDADLKAGALRSFAAELETDEFDSDDELAQEMDMKPSQIKAFRASCEKLRTLLGAHVQEFITEYRED